MIYRLLAMETARFSYSMQVMLEDLLPETLRPYLIKPEEKELSFPEFFILTGERVHAWRKQSNSGGQSGS